MASGWNLCECIGVVSGCCCNEVYRYPHNNYYFSPGADPGYKSQDIKIRMQSTHSSYEP